MDILMSRKKDAHTQRYPVKFECKVNADNFLVQVYSEYCMTCAYTKNYSLCIWNSINSVSYILSCNSIPEESQSILGRQRVKSMAYSLMGSPSGQQQICLNYAQVQDRSSIPTWSGAHTLVRLTVSASWAVGVCDTPIQVATQSHSKMKTSSCQEHTEAQMSLFSTPGLLCAQSLSWASVS